MSNIDEVKLIIAKENAEYFRQKGISLEGKKVLDVGFGLGYNASIMKRMGAEVFGVEPDKKAFDFAVFNNLIDKEKAFNCLLQEMPQELLGTFDIATVFLYNIPLSERENFAQALAMSIKDDGETIIGLHDDIYIDGDEYLKPVSVSVSESFDNLQLTKTNNFGNRLFIRASGPKIINKRLR